MKINELLMNIHNKDFKLESGLQVRKYLPIEVKKTIAQSIIYDCTDNASGIVKVDSLARYMSYVRHMIVTHTNLEYTDKDYDIICSTEYGDTTLLNAIIECFGEDAKECSRILELVMGDYMQESTIDFTMAKLLHDASSAVSKIASKITQVIGELDVKSIIPESVDMNKLGDFLKNYIK